MWADDAFALAGLTLFCAVVLVLAVLFFGHGY
jgi:hypothetical protein